MAQETPTSLWKEPEAVHLVFSQETYPLALQNTLPVTVISPHRAVIY